MDERRIPPRPEISRFVAHGLNRINAFFDRLYHSAYNPFYRSGTLAIGLLFVLLATGFYLLFFYSVSDPYGSVVRIQEQVWFGRWIRALHRYATDATLIAVFFHVLQLLAQGKTWGPRTLAWVSGMILCVALFISAWTGYVMVWDQHGLLLALNGLELLKVFPFLSHDMAQAFSGKDAIPASFFFMNLFLHIAIPLGMVFGMWIHTARLARAVWFPVKSIFWGTLVALTILSILVPCVLTPKADLLQSIGRLEVDWWFGFWIPAMHYSSPTLVLACAVGLFLAGVLIPLWWRPARSIEPPISEVDEQGCTGCTQCARDCPYDAIKMVPHPNGKHLLAEVSEAHCVSCGICAASCDVMAVGPRDRNARDQIARFEAFCKAEFESEQREEIVVIGCTHNDSMPTYLEGQSAKHLDLHYLGINCCGTLHSDTIEKLLTHAGGVLLVGCAARNCMNRDGLDILLGRLYGKRVPFLSRDVDRTRIVVASNSETEHQDVHQKYLQLKARIHADVKPASKQALIDSKIGWYLKRTVATTALLAMIAVLSQFPLGEEPENATVRLVGRLPGYVDLGCRAPTSLELAQVPAHMRKREICERKVVRYRMQVHIDGTEVVSQSIVSRSKRGELPVLLNRDVAMAPGSHKIDVTIKPENEEAYSAQSFRSSEQITISKGEIHLVSVEV